MDINTFDGFLSYFKTRPIGLSSPFYRIVTDENIYVATVYSISEEELIFKALSNLGEFKEFIINRNSSWDITLDHTGFWFAHYYHLGSNPRGYDKGMYIKPI